MKTAFRVAALFVVYGGIGLGGDYAASLMGQGPALHEEHVVDSHRLGSDADVEVVVDVQPEVVVDVQLRHSGGECSFSADHRMAMPTTGVDRLSIGAGSGSLRVEGARDSDVIVVEATACASKEAWLEELRMTVDERSSGELALIAHYPENRGWTAGNNTARIDLFVSVPLGFDVSIDDSSGDIVVSGTGDLEIDDSSGSIEVDGIDGHVRIDDSSGSLEIVDVSGDVEVSDGSGGIDIRNVRGSVVLRDGSGGIDVAQVGRDVDVEADGSGSIEVSDVAGDFTVGADGSGGIRHSNVGGTVDIPQDERRRRRGGR